MKFIKKLAIVTALCAVAAAGYMVYKHYFASEPSNVKIQFANECKNKRYGDKCGMDNSGTCTNTGCTPKNDSNSSLLSTLG